MAFYDNQAILEDADSLTVAEYLGLEIRHSSNRHMIYCPGHEKRLGKPDSKMGSCYLTNNGYHCFACGKSISIVDMVMEVEDCNYGEALGIIADSLGGREHYVVSGKVDTERSIKILPESDLNLIGLSSNVSFDLINGAFSTKEEVLEKDAELKEETKISLTPKIDIDDNAKFKPYLAVSHQTVSLKSIYQVDQSFYENLIKTHAKNKLDLYKTWVDNIDKEGSKEYNAFISSLEKSEKSNSILLYEFRTKLIERYNRIKEIYLQNSDDEDTFEVIEFEKPKIRLDLFDDI